MPFDSFLLSKFIIKIEICREIKTLICLNFNRRMMDLFKIIIYVISNLTEEGYGENYFCT